MSEPWPIGDADKRAAQPFIFRSGGVLGSKEVWTIREAVQHMDRYPAAGLYHLYNDTLIHWLEAEGATDLAQLARDAMAEARTDRRKALAIFLAGTGLVARPRLLVQPKTLNLGYAITGETLAGYFYLLCGCRRGYLFGAVEPGASWLRVWPHTFAGNAIELAVTADTTGLPIRAEPYTEKIQVTSSALAEPLWLPVELRVVAEPAPVARFVCRPTAGLLSGLLPGSLVGWLWGQIAPVLPPQLTAALGLESSTLWMLAVLALWAIAGLARGLCQPLPWPVSHALRVWLIRLALWASALMLAGLALAAWWQISFGPPGQASKLLYMQAAVVGLALATAPATIFASRRHPKPLRSSAASALYGRLEDGPAEGMSPWRTERTRKAIWGTIAVLFVALVLVFIPLLAHMSADELTASPLLEDVYNQLGSRLERLNAAFNDIVDELYLRYYDRRAPLPPTPTGPQGLSNVGRLRPC